MRGRWADWVAVVDWPAKAHEPKEKTFFGKLLSKKISLGDLSIV
jgi:hypothetical protein